MFATLYAKGNVVIDGPCPIDCSGTIKIIGLTPGSTLTLKSQEGMQPCIGINTVISSQLNRFRRGMEWLNENSPCYKEYSWYNNIKTNVTLSEIIPKE